jgi:hypothetical protein
MADVRAARKMAVKREALVIENQSPSWVFTGGRAGRLLPSLSIRTASASPRKGCARRSLQGVTTTSSACWASLVLGFAGGRAVAAGRALFSAACSGEAPKTRNATAGRDRI